MVSLMQDGEMLEEMGGYVYGRPRRQQLCAAGRPCPTATRT